MPNIVLGRTPLVCVGPPGPAILGSQDKALGGNPGRFTSFSGLHLQAREGSRRRHVVSVPELALRAHAWVSLRALVALLRLKKRSDVHGQA